MPADGISLPFTISGNVGSSRPEEQLSCRDYEYHTAHPKATFCRTSASAECRHWSGRAVRWSSGAILLRALPSSRMDNASQRPPQRVSQNDESSALGFVTSAWVFESDDQSGHEAIPHTLSNRFKVTRRRFQNP